MKGFLTVLLPLILRLSEARPASARTTIVNNVTHTLFDSLEELSRIVDISYCVGSTGIQKPFSCLGRCTDFAGFELIDTWNTGPLLSDSCGYIALSHPPHPKRVLVAFRGTYSIANTVVDLSTTSSEYLPFPEKDDDVSICPTVNSQDVSKVKRSQRPLIADQEVKETPRCNNCTVHAGFMTSWRNTRCIITPNVDLALARYPDYQLTLVGHSLGGAVAALAALEFRGRGWDPHVTTFGEPRIGNQNLQLFIDKQFNLTGEHLNNATYRRVTHVNDPVPLLPLEEWGFHMHAGEVFISKPELQPQPHDLRHCNGDEDPTCIQGQEASDNSFHEILAKSQWHVPTRYKLWELFFAHRDYFWRLGLCVPGGDPRDWWRDKHPRTEDLFSG